MVANGDRIYLGTRAYVNVKTEDRLLSKMIANNAENIYSFNFYFGRYADAETAKKYAGTYWMRAPELDIEVGRDVTTQEVAVARQF